MRLRIYRDATAFTDALAASSHALYSICNRDRFDPAHVMRLERQAAENQHQNLLSLEILQAQALPKIECFFRDAAQLDPGWLYAYSSKVVLSITEYQDLQKIFLLRCHFAQTPHRDVLMLVPDARLRQLFSELFDGAPPAVRIAFAARRAWARFARTFLRAVMNRGEARRARALLFTLNTGTPTPGLDAYFGQLAQYLDALAPTMTVYLASGPTLRLPRSGGSVPFEAFVSALDVVRAWAAALVSGVQSCPVTSRASSRPDLAPLHDYLRRSEIERGEHFMHQLMKRGFRRMLTQVSPETLVYPFENRCWEKHLLAAARAHGTTRCIAYQHSSITPRHLAFHIDHGEIPHIGLPDKVITIGDVTADMLRRRAPGLSGKVEPGVSLRAARQTVSKAAGAAVLVAISSSRNEALSLLQITHAAAGRASVPFIVRSHPTIPIADLFALFEWPHNVKLSCGVALTDDLSRVSMVAYSSSTVALEGMLHGRLPIFLNLGDVPSGDPIMGEHSFKFSACDGTGLAQRITSMQALGCAELLALRDRAQTFAERYLLEPTPEAIRRMAVTILSA